MGTIPVGLDIKTFKGVFETGARSYLFYMQPNIPNSIAAGNLPIYLVKATSLPSSNFDDITASWQGFDYKTAGKRTFDTWNVTFNVDINATIRKAFAEWQRSILDPLTNIHGMPTTYLQDQTVALIGLNFSATPITYTLIGAYPSSVAEVALDYTDSNFATFDVTFTYQYFTVA